MGETTREGTAGERTEGTAVSEGNGRPSGPSIPIEAVLNAQQNRLNQQAQQIILLEAHVATLQAELAKVKEPVKP